MKLVPPIIFDDTLREVVNDPLAVELYLSELMTTLSSLSEPIKKAKLLGEIAAYQRIVGRLEDAEATCRESLRIIDGAEAEPVARIQQELRLAHILQWQKRFGESTLLFTRIIDECRAEPKLNIFLAFALQHAGKNRFDQAQYSAALKLFTEALEIRVKTGAPRDQIHSTEHAISVTRSKLEGNLK